MSLDRTCNSSSWTKEEDKAFENALAVYSGDSDKFLKIAAAVPGKSLQEIIEHYNVLVEDINDIESGRVPLPKYERMQSSSSCRSRLSGAEVERRKGLPWTAEEHRSFLQGLAKHGKGDWRGISRNFVFSRTPTQVASHAQKYYSRLNDNNNGKRRKSIHDITSVGAANITEPSQGQKSSELTGPCGGQLQWPIADYVTEAFDTGMLSLPGPVTNCTTDAIEGLSAVNPEKFPLGAALGSELNSSFRGVDEFLQGIEDLIIAPAEGTSGVCHGVNTETSPSLGVQPSVASGTRMYTHPISFPDVHEFLQGVEDLITVPAEGTSGACRGIDSRTSPSLSLQSSVAGGTRMYTHSVTVPAKGTSGVCHGVDARTSPSLSLQPSVAGGTRMYSHSVTVPAEGTSGARCGVDTRTSPSLSLQASVAGGSEMYTHPATVPAEGTSGVRHGVDLRTSPSLSLQSSVAGGTRMYTHSVTVPAEGTSEVCHGVDARTFPSISLQPSVAGGTRMYRHSVTVPAEGTSEVCHGVDTRTFPSLSLQPSVAGGTRMYRHSVTVPAEGTSGARCGVDTRTSPSLSLQPSVAGGSGMYTHPVTVPAKGTSGVHHGVDIRTSPSLILQPSVAGGTRMYPHPVNVPAEGTSGASHGVDTRTSPSLILQPSVVGGTGMYTHPVTVPAEGTSGARCGIDTRTSPSLSLQPSVAGGTGMYSHPVTVLAEGTSGVRCGVDTRTFPSLGLQPSVAGGTGMYTHAVNNVGYDLEELMTKQLVGASLVGPTVNTASLPSPIADHIGVHGCTGSSSGTKNGFVSTMEAPKGGFSVDSMQLPSIPGSSGGITYPCWEPSSKDDSIFDLEDLYPDHMFGFGK